MKKTLKHCDTQRTVNGTHVVTRCDTRAAHPGGVHGDILCHDDQDGGGPSVDADSQHCVADTGAADARLDEDKQVKSQGR
jgi:hypothetical protein